MSSDYHTAISVGAPGDAATVNAPLGQLDAAIGVVAADVAGVAADISTSLDPDGTLKAGAVDTAAVLADGVVTNPKLGSDAKVGSLAALLTTVKTSIQAALNEVYTRLAGISNADGTLKDGAVSSSAKIAAGAVAGTNIDTSAFAVPNLVWDALNSVYAPGYAFDTKVRWLNERALSIVDPDSANPSGGKTLRMDASVVNVAGKAIWLADAGLEIGQTPTFTVQCMAADGTWRLQTVCWTANSALVPAGSTNGSSVVHNGTVQRMAVTMGAIPATTAYITVELREVTAGSSRTLDVYKWWGVRSNYKSIIPPATVTPEMLEGRIVNNGIVFDPTNLDPDHVPTLTAWNGYSRWVNESTLSILSPDSNNPFPGARTLVFAYDASKLFAGKWISLTEVKVATGDLLRFHMLLYGTSGENTGLACRFYDASGVAVGAQQDGPTTRLGGAGVIKTASVSAIVPAGAVSVKVYIVRKTGATSTIYICALTGQASSTRGTVSGSFHDYTGEIIQARGDYISLGAAITAAASAATSYPTNQVVYGEHLLQDWGAQLAKIRQAVAGEQAVIAFVGDSWVDNRLISGPLKTALQAEYGDAGPGYCSASSLLTAPAGVTKGSAGTWTDRDNGDHPPGYGVDIASASSTDVATPAGKSWAATLTDARIFYLVQPDGGSFRWRVDAGSWTTVATAGTLGLGTVDIPTQTSASHTIAVEVTVAGLAGVTVMGIDTKILGSNGVRVHKLGNGGAAAVQYEEAVEAVWEAGLASLDPNLVILLLGTNDHSAEIVPASFNAQITEIVSRIQSAAPTADVLLLSPTGNGLTKIYTLNDYVNELRTVAVDEDVAMLDANLLMPSYTIGNSRGLYANTTHLNASGGQYVADALIRLLLVA